ncbi:MAG: sodium:solute symporter [Alphaproteobacteria bacterium]|nr:MAG: sodium:solute symporter [Alphaproteobacteria bacterium]
MIKDHPIPLSLDLRLNYRFMTGWCLCVAAFLLAFNPIAHAESLVSIKTHQIAPLSIDDTISHILVTDGQVVALGDNSAWVLSDGEEKWVAKEWSVDGKVLGVIGEGSQAFLLLGSEQNETVTRVERFLALANPEDMAGWQQIPSLPVSLVSAHGAILDDHIFVLGDSLDGVRHLLSVDLTIEQPEWISHDAGAMMTGVVTSMVAQNALILVTVRDDATAGDRLLQWGAGEGWSERSVLSGTVVANSGRAMGQGHVLYMMNEGGAAKSKLMSFYTITGSWATYGDIESATASYSVGWKNGILWGQPAAGGYGIDFSYVDVETGKQLLHSVDWLVILIYLVGMLGIGLYFYMQHAQGSKSDFFLGGRSIPFWAAGISLYASNASSISYIAVPAKAFATNWQYLMSNLIVIVGLIFVAIWIVPMLRRLNLMSIFQYLETRFHPSIRVLSSALYIVFQLGGRMTIILFLPSMAIATVTGFDVSLCILIMGGITIVYTVLGGMKAVIWTDVIQLFVMFGGTFFAIAFIFMMLDGGVGEFFSVAMADNKMELVDWSFNLTGATVWGFIFLITFDTILTFPKDQVLMQRVLSTKTAKDASRSIWTFAAIVLPGSVLFYLVGTALYVFYQSHPERMDPSLSIDATFPLFIAAELPIGITGLIIAGIFAASMSTLSSILNSVATLATVDFYEKIFTNSSEKITIRFAEIATVVAGLIGISLALLLTRFEIKSLLDLALELWGLLGGGFAGAYTLGMFTRRANWQGVVIGVAVSIIVTLGAWMVDLVHPYFYLPLSVFVCIVVGYAASWLFPAPASLKGLTIYQEDVS